MICEKEVGSSEAPPTKRSVNVFQAAVGGSVVGLDRSAVEYASGGGVIRTFMTCAIWARMILWASSRDLGRSGPARAGLPDGFVGDDERGKGCRVNAFQGDSDLKIEDVGGEVGFALVEVLADADDGDDAVGEGRLQLEVDGGVGLVEVLAALGVSDENVSDSEWPVIRRWARSRRCKRLR